jgi:simple sugar transport system substrate-binding protein
VTLILSLLLFACGPGAEDGPDVRILPGSDVAARGDLRFVAVTHGVAADPFWSVVANGVEDAAVELGVRVDYQAITTFDMVDMGHLVDAAVASRPHGLVVSVPDVDALGPSIEAAVAAGIPVISINSGGHAFQSLGVLAHVGQPEHEAGYQGGERLAAAGARRALCVNHEVGNMALDLRCRGLEDAMADAGGTVSVLAVDLTDPEDAQQRVRGALAADPSIDGLLALGTTGAEPTLHALEELGRTGGMPFGTFDLSPSVLEAVRDGAMLFALDQQQYLQGYLPIVLLTKYLETGTIPGGGQPIPTGPRFITTENAEAVMGLTVQGIR